MIILIVSRKSGDFSLYMLCKGDSKRTLLTCSWTSEWRRSLSTSLTVCESNKKLRSLNRTRATDLKVIIRLFVEGFFPLFAKDVTLYLYWRLVLYVPIITRFTLHKPTCLLSHVSRYTDLRDQYHVRCTLYRCQIHHSSITYTS
jgi:hypothetical protein